MAPREQFLKYLREGLNHLYDPAALRTSPLAELFDVAQRFDTASMLQNILTTAIEGLRPKQNEASIAAGKRSYEILTFRYLQQFSQQEVADQLGMSVRSLRRAQEDAIEKLALYLWKKYTLNKKFTGQEAQPPALAPESASDDLSWLKTAPVEQPANIARSLPEILTLVGPLAQNHHVSLDLAEVPTQPDLTIHPIALRQVLLNLLNLAIVRAASGHVQLLVRSLPTQAEIILRCASPALADRLDGSESATLDLVRHMVELFSGSFVLESGPKLESYLLRLPFLEQIPVLVIDDHTDTLDLYERFVSRTHYHLIKTSSPEGALALAEKVCPKVIVLDVMMAPIDGLEVLGRLKQHPLVGHIPVLVSTILAQEELVLSLGASAFLRKPVNRQDFLRVLDDLSRSQAEESR